MGYFGSSAFAGIKAGSSDVTKIYVGSTLAWSAAPAATDPNFSSVQLLLHGEGADAGTTIVDSSSNAFSPSALTNVTTSTTQFKYGSASLRFNAGVAEYANNAAFYPAGGDFTWEAFVRFDTKTFNGLFVLGDSVAAGFGVNFTYEFYFHNTSNTLRFVYSTDGTNITTKSYPFTPTANTWYHIAAVRSGTDMGVFVDGTLLSTSAISGTFFNNTTAPYRLGCIRGDGVDVYQLTGYMDEVRFTKGIARYTGNFTPPTAAFPDS
jgi:hypothetical protein